MDNGGFVLWTGSFYRERVFLPRTAGFLPRTGCKVSRRAYPLNENRRGCDDKAKENAIQLHSLNYVAVWPQWNNDAGTIFTLPINHLIEGSILFSRWVHTNWTFQWNAAWLANAITDHHHRVASIFKWINQCKFRARCFHLQFHRRGNQSASIHSITTMAISNRKCMPQKWIRESYVIHNMTYQFKTHANLLHESIMHWHIPTGLS